MARLGMVETGWKYYLPNDGEEEGDAAVLSVYSWQRLFVDAEEAAEAAAKDEWNNRDGWDAGINNEPVVIVISPSGEHSKWIVSREAAVIHNVRKEE